MSMTFERKNGAGDTHQFDVISYDINLYRDPLKPHTCKLVVPKNAPFQMFDIVTAESCGHIPFRGYVTNLSIPVDSIKIKTIECESIETALNHRYLPVHSWSKVCTFERIFSSVPPDQVLWSPWFTPLIWFAQSYIPPAAPDYDYQATGTGYPYGNPNITNINGAGYLSRVGTKDIYLWDKLATEYDSFSEIPEVLPGPCLVRESDRLRMMASGDFKGHTGQNYGLSADLAFDFGLRVRSVDSPTDALGFHLRSDFDPAWDLIVNLAQKLGLNVHIWYAADGLTYLDFIESSGRGEGAGQLSFYEDDIFIEPLSPSLKTVSALIGRGAGEGPSRQIASSFDLNYRGLWIEDLVDIPNGFSGGSPLGTEYTGNMEDIVSDQYDARNTDLGFRLKLHPEATIPWITDHVALKMTSGGRNVYEVKRICYSSSSPYVLVDIGLTPDDLYDAFQAGSALNTVGGELPYISQNPYSDSQDMQFGDADSACSPATFSVTFATGAGYYDNCRIMATFSYSLTDCMEYPIGSNPAVTAHAFCYAEINGKTQDMYIGGGNYILGDAVTFADITDFLKLDGTAESIKFYVKWYGYFSGAAPTVSVSMTLTPVWLE